MSRLSWAHEDFSRGSRDARRPAQRRAALLPRMGTGSPEFRSCLTACASRGGQRPPEVEIADALADWVGLAAASQTSAQPRSCSAAAVVGELPAADHDYRPSAPGGSPLPRRVRGRWRGGPQSRGPPLLAEMPVERLKDATRERLRIGPLTDAGITHVQAVLEAGLHLEYLPGIGATTATRMRGAAQTLWQTTYDEMPVRIDIKNRTSRSHRAAPPPQAWDSMRTDRRRARRTWRCAERSDPARPSPRQASPTSSSSGASIRGGVSRRR